MMVHQLQRKIENLQTLNCKATFILNRRILNTKHLKYFISVSFSYLLLPCDRRNIRLSPNRYIQVHSYCNVGRVYKYFSNNRINHF